MYLAVEIKGEVDALMLWKLIKSHNLNLLESGNRCWVYGEADYTAIGDVVSKCALFGNITAEITKGGGKNEQEKKEKGSESAERL